MAIDVGYPAIARSEAGSGVYTIISDGNPANATGTINHLEIYDRTTVSTVEVASFYLVSGSNYSTRGNVGGLTTVIGLAEFDAPGDFTAFDINENDLIGVYPDSIERGAGGTCSYRSGDNIPCTNAAFTTAYAKAYSLYGTGTEAGGSTYNESVTFSSTPALSNSVQADFLGSIGLASTPALSSSALADFYNSLTLASTPAAVMAAVADLFASLALASDPTLAVVGGSDFYESLALSSSPALATAVFKEAFGELVLSSSPALSVSVQADLYAAITILSACGISLTAMAELFANLTLSSIPALSALGQIGGTIIQKMVMESIGVREISLKSEVEKLTGDIDIVNRILSNPWDDIAKKSTTWERTEKRQKDEQ